MKQFYRNKNISENKNRCIKKKSNIDINKIKKINYSKLQDIVYIDLRDVCNYEINPFGKIDIHTQMTKEIINNINIDYKKTKLYQYYKNYSPENLSEVYKVKYDKNDNNKILTTLSPHTIFEPWVHNKPVPLDTFSHCGLFGPKTDSFIKNEFNRTKNVILSIQKNTYDPLQFFDNRQGFITIQLYKYNDNYKIYVIAGNHRSSVLKAMGIYNVPVIFQQNEFLKNRNKLNNSIYNPTLPYQKIIDHDNIDNWPGVKSGFITKTEASKMFSSFFTN